MRSTVCVSDIAVCVCVCVCVCKCVCECLCVCMYTVVCKARLYLPMYTEISINGFVECVSIYEYNETYLFMCTWIAANRFKCTYM